MQRMFVSVVAVAALAASACAVEEDTGGVELTLTGTSPSGQVYRLRNAELTVAGARATVVLRTEDDPRRERIDFRVSAGRYQLTLAPGWHLERVAADGSAARVPAVLETSLPMPFVIVPERFTPITLRFRVNGDPIDFGDGTGGIDLDIDDSPDGAPLPDAPFGPDAGPGPDARPAQAILVSPTSLNMTEGSVARFAVTLAAPPNETLTVQIASSSPSVTVSPAVVTFTPLDYAVPHPVVVTALRDPDIADEAAVITVAAPGLLSARVAVVVEDTDVVRIVPSVSTLVVNESNIATFNVHLAARPIARVLVMVRVVDDQVSARPSSLVFTPDNYNVDQAVTVSAPNDADTVDSRSSLQLTASGLETATVAISIVDDDEGGIDVFPEALTVTEGVSSTLGVYLGAAPVGNAVVSIRSTRGQLVATPSSLVFTPSNWGNPQVTTINAAVTGEDRVDELVLSTPGLPPVSVPVTIRARR